MKVVLIAIGGFVVIYAGMVVLGYLTVIKGDTEYDASASDLSYLQEGI